MSVTVTSQVMHFPACHGICVRPFGRFPSDLTSPAGSLTTGMLARPSARQTRSLSAWCRVIRQNNPTIILLSLLSRASAAALSTVLRTSTTLSYGNMRIAGTRPAETLQPIKMKFCTINYVGELTRCAKNGWNRLAGSGPTDR